MAKQNWYTRAGRAVGGFVGEVVRGVREDMRRGLTSGPEAREKDLGYEVVADVTIDQLARSMAPHVGTGGQLQQYRSSLYVFACISKIAQAVGRIDFELYRIINSKGDMKEIGVHPVIDLLYKPNPYQSKSEFWEITMVNLKAAGNAFWLKVRNDRGVVTELWNLRPDWMTVVQDPQQFVKEFRFKLPDGKEEVFMPEEILHFKGSPDPLSQHLGMSVLRPAQVIVQTDEYMTRYNRDFFLNSARPDAVIKNPKKNLDAEQKEDIREGWAVRHKGFKNIFNVAVLDGGLEYQQISLNQKEMEYIEGKKFTRDDILVAFQVPKIMLSIVEDVNRANAETGLAIFLGQTIAPEMKRIVEKINEQLVIPDFGDDLELDFDDPTPSNRDIELQEYREGLQFGYMLVNEVRAREGLEPIKGGWTAYRPISDVPVGGLPDKNTKGETMRSHVSLKLGAMSKDKAYEIQPVKKSKTFKFRGRSVLKMKLELAEELAGIVGDAVKAVDTERARRRTKAKSKDERKFTPMLKGDVRKMYGDLVVKRIDLATDQLREETDKFFAAQEERVQKALKKAAKSAKKKDVSVEDIFDESAEAELTASFIAPFIEQYLVSSGKESLLLIAPAEEFDVSKRIRDLIKKRAKLMGKETTRATAEKLSAALAEGVQEGEGATQLSARVADVYEEFPTYRSERIARTEATSANNAGTIEGFRQSNVTNGKEWIATEDDRTRDSHSAIDGDIVGIDAKFGNGLSYPGDPSGLPEEVINCRCVLGPAFLE